MIFHHAQIVDEKPRNQFPVATFQSANVTLAAQCIAKNVVVAVALNVDHPALPMLEKYTPDINCGT